MVNIYDSNIVGIIGAMDEEIEQLKEIMEVEEVYEQAGLKFYYGQIKLKNVVLVCSGIGKVNAALCTQILIDKFDIKYIINTGVAGAVSQELNIGDIVISSDAVYHDFDTTILGYKRGEIPRMEQSFFKADEKLIEIAQKAGKTLNVEHRVFVKRVVSGDQFIADTELKNKIYTDFEGYCTEMEGTAIAHVCFLNKVPYVIIRSISDKADHSAEMNYNDFVLVAAKNSSIMIQKMLEQLN